MKRILFIVVTPFLLVFSVLSQTREDIVNGEIYMAQVKLISEFIERFNLQTQRADLDSMQNTPSNNLLMLFDLQQFPSRSDSSYIMAEEFIETILRDSIKIVENDGKWFAKLHTNVLLAQKKKQCAIYLSYVSRGEDMYKWQISAVEGEIFTPQNIIPDLYISPTAYEMDFIELYRISKETYKYIDSYFPSDYEYNSLSAFSFAMSNGLLKIESIEKVEFVFEQVPGFRFYISYFIRDNKNSGWLINKLERR